MLTEEELANQAGAPLEDVRRFVKLGIVKRRAEAERPFGAPDIEHVRLVQALERSGLSAEQFAVGLERGAVDTSWIDPLFPDPVPYLDMTWADHAKELNVSFSFLERVVTAAGLPAPQPSDPIRADDAAVSRLQAVIVASGVPEEEAVRLARFFGDNIRRLTESMRAWFRNRISSLEAESDVDTFASSIARDAVAYTQLAEDAVLTLYRRHVEHMQLEESLLVAETALEKAGLGQRTPERPPAIAFLDLSGYTALTEREGDASAARLATALGDMVQLAADAHNGRAVKYLGDGVMFAFASPVDAVLCGLDLVRRADEASLPAARMGIHSGPVVFEGGDYFGRTVNIAARVTDYARPREVLVTGNVVQAASSGELAFEEIGPVSLKGLPEPVELWRARAPAPARG